MRRHRLSIPARIMGLAAAFLVLSSLAPLHAEPVGEPAAKRLIQKVVSDAVIAFGGKTLEPNERRAKLAELIDRYGDIPIYSQDVLGRYWKRASSTEQSDFNKLLPRYLQGCWTGSLSDMPTNLRVDFTTVETSPNGRTIVHSLATVPNDTLAIDWTVTRSADGHPILADVTVDGMSVFQTIQSDFMAALRANGGKLDVLFAAVQQKIAAQQETP
jgi:phospholipid transport system substrate-binding protein